MYQVSQVLMTRHGDDTCCLSIQKPSSPLYETVKPFDLRLEAQFIYL